MFYVLIGYIINGIIFGSITRYISRSKGYENGFAWGFWLGIIGLLVVGFRPDQRVQAQTPSTNWSSTQSCAQDRPTEAVKSIPKENKSSPSQLNESIQLAELLQKLSDLHKQGILNDAEFESKKVDILQKMLPTQETESVREYHLDQEDFTLDAGEYSAEATVGSGRFSVASYGSSSFVVKSRSGKNRDDRELLSSNPPVIVTLYSDDTLCISGDKVGFQRMKELWQ